MRTPYGWLESYCRSGLAPADLADRLTMTGTKVEELHRLGVGDVSEFVVGRVLSAERHPDADRLTVCEVDVGGSTSTIVCGAPNVAAGQIVAVAKPGAIMPDGSQLGEAELRGVKSSGMILAEDEVGISDAHAEIMVLGNGATPGQALDEVLPIADEVLELEITPNRADCLAVYGVAREVHAITGHALAPDPSEEDAQPQGDDTAEDHCTVDIDPEICLRFTARVFEDVKIGPSPLWLKQRLTAAGQRPISNVVDITNYVMLTCGQPLHAFDLDEVRGRKIVVRRAEPGEKMLTLDGVEREFDESIAVVCDAEGPSGIAGIMGGEISEVSDKTTRVLMEAATWVGTNILKSEAKLQLRTEASSRFEKQLHPDLGMAAQRLAARLMVELCGARLVPGTIDVYPSPLPPRTVKLRLARVTKLIGVEIPEDESRGILERLGFGVTETAGAAGEWEIDVPFWRDGDVQREADVIEEIARVYGLDKVPTTMPARRQAVGRLTPQQKVVRGVEDELRDHGLSEVIAWSFTAPETLARLRLGALPALRMANPMSEDLSVMRPLLLPGLLDAAQHNAARGRTDIALFESAHVYRPSGPLAGAVDPATSPQGAFPTQERHHLGAVLTGRGPRGWRTPAPPMDFFRAKGLVEALLGSAGIEWWAEPGERPFLHPGRSATVVAARDERKLGWIGELHPLVAREWDLESAVAFELDLDLLAELAAGPPQFAPVSAFPPVIQDIAVVVADEIPAGDVEAAIAEGGGELLARLELFDVYRGEQVGTGNKSLAIRLEFQAPDRTLTDDEVSGVRALIEDRIGELGGRLRA
ncbi:MAG: phenylalanyl-tRNA synthetase beta chain [Thermoleophilaceae bacterium]|nr:phenylalanyl-tRNA synthetase beta chain [Thermoleophilaceae bacterium]